MNETDLWIPILSFCLALFVQIVGFVAVFAVTKYRVGQNELSQKTTAAALKQLDEKVDASLKEIGKSMGAQDVKIERVLVMLEVISGKTPVREQAKTQ